MEYLLVVKVLSINLKTILLGQYISQKNDNLIQNQLLLIKNLQL